MELQLQRVVLTGTTKQVQFSQNAAIYLVKNFTSGDIYVSFNSNLVESKAIKIASGYAQECCINENAMWHKNCNCNSIYVKGTGEVEVQQVWY